MSEYTLSIRMKIHPDKVDHFLEMMLEITAKTKDEPGCLVFEMRRDPAEENIFIVFESFVDKAAFDVHDKSEYHQRNGPGLREAIAEIDMREVEPVGFSAEIMRRSDREGLAA